MTLIVSLFLCTKVFGIEKLNIDTEKMQKEALALYESEINSIKQEVWEKQASFQKKDAYQDMKNAAQKSMRHLQQSIQVENNTDGGVLVFVSWSMPEEALRQWMREAITFGASLNVRGLIAEDFPKSIAKMQKFVEENNNEGGINIDPDLFEQYDINKVPAVIVRKNDNPVSPFDIVYGTSSIKEALRIIGEEGIEAKEQAIKGAAI